MKNRHVIEGAHVPRELLKVTGMKDGKVIRTEPLGIWYIPLIWGLHEKNQIAREMGGDRWGRIPACFTGDQFRWYDPYGVYAIDYETEPERRWSKRKSED
jgi:hypothetical protein